MAEFELMSFHMASVRALSEWSEGLHNGATPEELEQLRQLTYTALSGSALGAAHGHV